MPKCIDPDIGKLLHAYELKALSEEDEDRFEVHLLECEHCFEELQAFEQKAALLTSDDDVKGLVLEAIEARPIATESLRRRIWRYLWPKAPVLFRPALAWVVVLVMIVPAYLGLHKSRISQIGSPQKIVLVAEKSAGDRYFDISLRRDGLIRFIYRDAVAGRSYRVFIESAAGTIFYEDARFDDFDEYGQAELSFPLGRMRPGLYRLVVIDPEGEPGRNRTEYSFTIRE
jgi:hypothetical protein